MIHKTRRLVDSKGKEVGRSLTESWGTPELGFPTFYLFACQDDAGRVHAKEINLLL